MAKLTDDELKEWTAAMSLADVFYEDHVLPTERYSAAYKYNEAHWPDLDQDDLGVLRSNHTWPYDAITANMMYAHYRSHEPSVIMRHPKVNVRPASRVTNRFRQLAAGAPGGQDDPFTRFVAAALVQQICNWRVREFDFKKQMTMAYQDDYFRGFGIIRHGYIPETTRRDGKKTLLTEPHKHKREGWPYAVYTHLSDVRFDALPRDPDEQEWVAFRDWWRLDDLKADPRKFSIPENASATHISTRLPRNPKVRIQFEAEHTDALGRVEVWQIWDRRKQRIIYWGPWGRDILIEDWPFKMDSLPYTLIRSNVSNDGLDPFPEPSIYWDLQQELNKLVSLVMVYAKRGVPLIGVNSAGMDDAQIEKLKDAEILETIIVNGDPASAIKALNLTPDFNGVLQAIAQVRDLMGDITGQSKLGLGSRENVESGTEAAGILQGQNTRTVHRQRVVSDAFAEVIRKDWQIFQQVTNEDQIIDIVDFGQIPNLFKLTPEQINMEFDFEIQVGSMAPDTEQDRQRRALGLIQAAQSHPDFLVQFQPRQLARIIAQAYGWEESEILANPDAVQQQQIVDTVEGMMEGGGGARGGGGPGVGAALDASAKAPQSQATQ